VSPDFPPFLVLHQCVVGVRVDHGRLPRGVDRGAIEVFCFLLLDAVVQSLGVVGGERHQPTGGVFVLDGAVAVGVGFLDRAIGVVLDRPHDLAGGVVLGFVDPPEVVDRPIGPARNFRSPLVNN